MEGISLLVTCAKVSLLLCCAPLIQGSCLRGFSEEIPPREEWGNFSTTVIDNGGRNDYTYLFPSLRFTCSGMLQELTFPIELRGSASRHWDNILNIRIKVLRPSRRTGYNEIEDINDSLVTSQTNSIVTLGETEVLQFSRTLAARVRIQANDVIALTYDGRRSVNDLEVAEHCPFLFQEEPSSIILKADASSFMPLGSDFFLPIIMANFIPDSTPLPVSPDTPTGTPPGAELTPSTDSEVVQSFFDNLFAVVGITAAAVQIEVLLAIVVTAVIVCGCKRRAQRNCSGNSVKRNTVQNIWTNTMATQTNRPDPYPYAVHEYDSLSHAEYYNTHSEGNRQKVEEDTPIEEYGDTAAGNSSKTGSAAYYYI